MSPSNSLMPLAVMLLAPMVVSAEEQRVRGATMLTTVTDSAFTPFGAQLEGDDNRVRVQSVLPGTAAEAAGLLAGDVIVSVNGAEVKSMQSALIAFGLAPAPQPADGALKLSVLRKGKPQVVEVPAFGRTVELERFPTRLAAAGRGVMGIPSIALAREPGGISAFMEAQPTSELAGIEFVTLTPQLGTYFGTDKGVLVTRAPTPAESGAEIRDGDVILSIDGREPTTGSHANRILASYVPGEKIHLRVIRQRKPMEIEVTVRPMVAARGFAMPMG